MITTEDINTAKNELADRISAEAVIHGDVVLSSGAIAPYYVDLRRITLQHRGGQLIGILLRDLLSDWEYDHIGGLTMGADPVATAVMHAAGRPIDAFVVRKAVKTHGLHRLIEGPNITGRSVVIVEDSSTTGASALQAVETAVNSGAKVVGVAAVVDRNTGARERIEAAGYPYRFLLGLADLQLAPQLGS